VGDCLKELRRGIQDGDKQAGIYRKRVMITINSGERKDLVIELEVTKDKRQKTKVTR